MATPVLLVVDDNPDSLKALDGVLRHRYGHDYLIISEASPGTALGRLRELRAADRPVEVVMAAGAMTAARPPFPLETSLPGAFAAGDVRHGSVKRVASAVGEGSIATTQVTQYLQQQARSS